MPLRHKPRKRRESRRFRGEELRLDQPLAPVIVKAWTIALPATRLFLRWSHAMATPGNPAFTVDGNNNPLEVLRDSHNVWSAYYENEIVAASTFGFYDAGPAGRALREDNMLQAAYFSDHAIALDGADEPIMIDAAEGATDTANFGFAADVDFTNFDVSKLRVRNGVGAWTVGTAMLGTASNSVDVTFAGFVIGPSTNYELLTGHGITGDPTGFVPDNQTGDVIPN